MGNEFHIKGIYSTEACTMFQLAMSCSWLLNTHKNDKMLYPSNTSIDKKIRYAKDMSLHFDLNMEFSNYYAADMLVKARRSSLVQRLNRLYAVSYNVNPVAALYVILPNTCSSAYLFTPWSKSVYEALPYAHLYSQYILLLTYLLHGAKSFLRS